ncbi:hypothetical protein E4695_04210 [Alcaligenaceae bacterium 429]|nr:hypothetical protein E4695_04210 [Alcaligenaceae bacterium 429]
MSQDIRSLLEANVGQTLNQTLIEGLIIQLTPHLTSIAEQGIQAGRSQVQQELQAAQAQSPAVTDVELNEQQ